MLPTRGDPLLQFGSESQKQQTEEKWGKINTRRKQGKFSEDGGLLRPHVTWEHREPVFAGRTKRKTTREAADLLIKSGARGRTSGTN